MLTSCERNTIYSAAQTIPLEGWNADSAASFSFRVSDLTPAYDIIIFVRHKDDYPYQNLWLIVDLCKSAASADTLPAETICRCDTIEFYLADQRGRWLGSGTGKLKQMPVLYEQSHHFTDTCCTMTIRHAMRDETLRGVNDVGLKITKSDGY